MNLTTSDHSLAFSTRRSPAWTAALTIGALLLVFCLDRATGSAPVQHLYYLPIILAASGFGMRGGIMAAVAAIALYHVANPHLLTFRYEESDVVQIALFVAVGVITAKLRLDFDRLRQLAVTDDLTGLQNLRGFQWRLTTLLRASRETSQPLAMIALDVDRLKSLNDRYGHMTGADAVRTVGYIIGQRLPADAIACRYGGDEFAIAVPRCTPLLARLVADDLRRAVHGTAPVLAGREFAAGTLSISVGASCLSLDRDAGPQPGIARDVEDGKMLFHQADEALYRAKADGRNRVWVV
jgi:diguanylate cyclase (GGDEF)-like protein